MIPKEYGKYLIIKVSLAFSTHALASQMINFNINDGKVIVSDAGCTIEVLHLKQSSKRTYETKNEEKEPEGM